jgi:hypothetical protein
MVEAGGVESITQCSQELPQMMATGKCWCSQGTNKTVEFSLEKLAQSGKWGLNQRSGP